MRWIINRHHRQALAERKEAQAAAAPAKLPNATSWSTKPSRRTKPSNLERGLTERADANREQWRKRHPDVAKEQRILRKSQVQVGERWRNKLEGTPQTHEHASRTCQGALARLCKSGGIDAEQLVAAVEIAAVAERIGADVAVRSMSIETRIDGGRQGSDHFYEALSRVRHEVAYTRWRAQVRGPIGAILDMIVGETVGFTVVAKRYGMHNRRAKQLLIDALDLWPRILHQVVKEVDAATVAAAHAGIL
ncbi:hypothetical protein CA235_09605 [Sphingomonas sp. ABOLF]|nr:hypothetical protein CA235_09605 [Sphingomonas sp. ABOLF]